MNRSRFFNWGLLVLAFMLLLPGLGLAQGGGDDGNGNGGNNNRRQFNPQPVLIYTVSGGTLAGETLQTLIVYDNGLAVWSTLEGGNGGDCQVQTAQISQQQINTLLRDLRRAGAMRGNLQAGPNQQEPDVPLTTVTVFFNPGGAGRSLAQTFSFFSPQGTRARINDVLTNFLNQNFGDGGGNGGGGDQ
jgi:hypothetical protein